MRLPSSITRDEAIAWLEERAANCVRLAKTKKGMDKDGWLVDAAFFMASVRHLRDKREEQ
jgi:hypothetical protein